MKHEKSFWSSNLCKGLLMILVYIVFTFQLGTFLTTIGIDVTKLTDIQKVWIQLVFDILIIILLIIICFKDFSQNIKDFFKDFKSYFKRNFKYWLIAVAVMMISNLLIAIIFKQNTSANDQAVRDLFKTYPIYMLISTVIIAPLTEELIYRKSIRYLVKNKYAFIILSGLIFGIMHLASIETIADILYIIPYSVPGCMFAYMLVKEDNICVPMTFHMIHNILSVILLVISKFI